MGELAAANESFSTLVKSELSKISDKEFDLVYLVPQEEYFVLSLFLLNFRETALLVSQILSQVRTLLEIRQSRETHGFWPQNVVLYYTCASQLEQIFENRYCRAARR